MKNPDEPIGFYNLSNYEISLEKEEKIIILTSTDPLVIIRIWIIRIWINRIIIISIWITIIWIVRIIIIRIWVVRILLVNV